MFPFGKKKDKGPVDVPVIMSKKPPAVPERRRAPLDASSIVHPSLEGRSHQEHQAPAPLPRHFPATSAALSHPSPIPEVPTPLSSTIEAPSTAFPFTSSSPRRVSSPTSSSPVSHSRAPIFSPTTIKSTLIPSPTTNGHSEPDRIVFRPSQRPAENGHADSGAAHTFGSLKEFDIACEPLTFSAGLSLPALACVQVAERRLQIQRNIGGDFGFSIRRVQYPTASGELRTVVFVEPTDFRAGPPRPDDVHGLLPGDELVEVEGHRVATLSRDDLQEIVRSSGDTISLLVRAVPELAEFCSKHVASSTRDRGDSLQLTADVDTTRGAQELIPDDVRVWLLHKGGYTQARQLARLEDGRVKIVVAGREMVVDSTDVDRANASALDRVADVAGLKYINETSAVHVLRHRFGSGLAYTNAGGSSLLCITGTEEAPPRNEKLVSLFKGCRRAQMPPHIYATAQHIYRNIQQSGGSQSVLLTGVSGSGKSAQLREMAYYLSVAAGWTKALTFDRLSSAFGVLQAMGHAATSLHSDSSRFMHLLQLGFDRAAALKSAKLCPSLLESDRVLGRPEGESTFHIFYYLWEGADDALRTRLRLNEIDNPAPLMKRLRGEEDREQAREAWRSFLSALSSLGATQSAIDGICSTLGAIFHLARAEATGGAATKAQFVRAAHAQHAAALLGVTVDALTSACFRGRGGVTGLAAANAPSINRFSISNRALDGPDALKIFAGALYQELFFAVVEQLNKGLGSAASAATYINIVDPPGCTYSGSWKQGKSSKQGCTLYDLVANYVNDRLSEHFHDAHFAQMQELYVREQVEVEVPPPLGAPHSLNRLLDQKQQLLNSVDIERRSEERRGLLAIVEEESMFPGASDDSLLERIFIHLGDQPRLLRRGALPGQFVLAHGLDTHPTTYDVSGWVRAAYPSEIATAVRPMLTVTKSSAITALFNPSTVDASGGRYPGPSESGMRLRRLTQSAHLDSAGAGVATKRTGSFLANLATQTDYVFSTVRRGARSHFIHCIQSSTAPRGSSTGSHSLSSSSASSPGGDSSLDVPYVRNQMRGLLLMDAIRASNRGYPERFSFRDFRRRFECLIVTQYAGTNGHHQSTESSFTDAVDDRAAVQKILERMDVHESRFRLGMSQVLLQSDVVAMLEESRELSLSGLIVAFQEMCRAHLARKWLDKRRVLETAIRCIQKNGAAYMEVREWQWWRLYTKVVPLLAVSRTDATTREWEDKLRALERIISEMKSTKGRLEGRISELEEEVTRGASAAHELSMTLEREAQARLVAERRLAGAHEESERTSRVSSSARMIEEGGAIRPEVEATITALKTELEDARQGEESLRVRTQRTVEQLREAEAELAELRATNATLEKKQARFDAEYSAVELAASEQKRGFERIEKEREEAVATATRRANEVREARDETAELRAQLARLRREVEEGGGAGGSASDVEQLKKAKRDLEAKVKDQEEELDDLTGQHNMMQQTVTRLEMQSERMRQDMKREGDSRESEMEELRAGYQRRLRAFEEQVADLTESNQSISRQNRMLEGRVRQHDQQAHSLEFSGGVHRRELRKALALLADTEQLLAHEREANTNGALVRQLREQLEDTEAAKVAALKGRHGLESELAELRSQLEAALIGRKTAEDRALQLLREKNAGSALMEEKDEQMQSLLKKYKAAVQQHQIDGIAIADYIEQIADLMAAKQKLVDELHDRQSQLDYLHQHTVEKHKMLLLEQRLKEQAAKLDLEIAQRTRLESLIIKHTDGEDALNDRLNEAVIAKEREAEGARKAKKEIAALTEALEDVRRRETELVHRTRVQKSEAEKLEETVRKVTGDLKVAEKRCDAMRAALAEGLNQAADDDDDEFVREDEMLAMHSSSSKKKLADDDESLAMG